MIHEFVDMDTKEKIRYVSESSNTSGYSTMSPGPCGGSGVIQRNGNTSPGSVFSMPPSPALSPATTVLQAEFSNLNLPSTPQANYGNMAQHNVYGNINFSNATSTTLTNMQHPQFLMQQTQQQQQHMLPQFSGSSTNMFMAAQQPEHTAELHILEQPVEKFRFRYKSEMHGTHGSLNGANSKRTPKTYPEVELRNFPGKAIIRCSLFQTNLESPHSHQLVVRKDEIDICDPHNLEVSPETGFVAQFQNMGIIHTAKKFIFEELFRKKKDRRCFELGREELSTKEQMELRKQTEKEAKDMNLNQVRLCFEAFKIEENNTWSSIAAPVYTHPINNRKSAQTGELRIVRLSIATGSVTGGDDLILLVEKVSKKNIKVRFFEEDEDGAEVWEGWGKFRESDVHHQYAIVCQTPPYHNRDINKAAEVNIELLRPSDDERSYPPVTFRYRPRPPERKRRRTCSSATSSSGSGSSLNSEELPKTVKQVLNPANPNQPFVVPIGGLGVTFAHSKTISEEFEKSKILESEEFLKVCNINSEELQKICAPDFPDLSLMETDINLGHLEMDGAGDSTTSPKSTNLKAVTLLDKVIASTTLKPPDGDKADYLQRIFKIYDDAQRSGKQLTNTEFLRCAKAITELYSEHAERNEHNDSIMHDIIISDNAKVGIKTCHILKHFELNDLLNRILNVRNESALHYACLHERPLYIRPLLGMLCDPTIEDYEGNTALHVAVREQHSSCVDSFLNVAGLRLNLTQRNNEGETALHLAIRLKNLDVTKKLLEHESTASLVPKGKDGNNALHMAVNQQSVALVNMILDFVVDKTSRNALLTSRNTAGFTALDLARKLDTKLGNEIITLLIDANGGESIDEMIIKQEQTSSSSNEDDDDPEEPPQRNFDEVSIKVEESETEEDTIAYETQANYEAKIKEAADNLNEVLNDADKLRRIANLLNKNEKWREVATKARLHYLLNILTKAELLLSHVRAHSHLDYNKFARALAEVDSEAFNLFLTK